MSRIQGGWASAASQQKFTAIRPRPGAGAAIAQGIAFDESVPEARLKPAEKLLSTPGEHILSSHADGNASVELFPSFLNQIEADNLFGLLLGQLPFEQRYDRHGLQTRLTVWYGKEPYSYSGLTHPANPMFPLPLLNLKAQLESFTGRTFNSVLCNLYRDNKDHVEWHADDEPQLGDDPYIASVSLGAQRAFEMRQNPSKEDAGDCTYCQHVRIVLPHGSLLIMKGKVQQFWKHRLPREYHDRDPRINLTFRTIAPADDSERKSPIDVDFNWPKNDF